MEQTRIGPRPTGLTAALLLMTCFGVLTVALSATDIAISNPSFESQTIANNGFVVGTVDDWVISGGTQGAYNPGSNFYTNPEGDESVNSGQIGDMDGVNALFNINTPGSYVSQELTQSVAVGDTYTLTVAVGDRDTGGRPNFAGYEISLLAGGDFLKTISSTTSPGDGTFTDVELTYTAIAGNSGNLEIRLGMPANGLTSASVDFDNIRLQSSNSAALVAVTSIAERRIFQRGTDNQASLPVSGTFTGTVTEIQARAVAINGNGADTGWVTIDGAAAGGSYDAALTVRTGWYALEVRALDGAVEVGTDQVDRFGVGDLFIVTGQSNAANFGESAQTADDDRVSYCDVSASSWMHAADPPPNPSASTGTKGAPWPELGDLLAGTRDIPTGFINVADGSSNVESWLPASNDNYPNLRTAVQSLGLNGFKAVLWHQGERDKNEGTSTVNYVTRLEGVISASRNDAGWNVPWVIALVSYNSGVSQAIIDAQLQVIANDANVFQGAATDDLIGNNPETGLNWRYDGVHFSNDGLTEHAKRWFQALDEASLTPAYGITWGSATDVAGTSDVSTNGTLVEAFNLGYNAIGLDTVTVNTVTFTASHAPAPLSSESAALYDQLNGNTSGDADYDQLLNTVAFGGGPDMVSMTLGGGGLVEGRQYELQIWFVEERADNESRIMTFGDSYGKSVDVGGSAGLLGQYAIGTFTATGTTQILTLTPNDFENSHLTAYQIRALGQAFRTST